MWGASDKEAPRSLIGTETLAALLACAAGCPAGAFVEVGVYQGGSAWHLGRLALQQMRPLYLYDTFYGIPYSGPDDSHHCGDFADCDAKSVRRRVPNAVVIEGLFPYSAIEMGPIAFVHLDCDQYQSYREALEYFGTRMVAGGVIWCDDAPCLRGAARAVAEFVERSTLCALLTPESTGKSYLQF